MHTQTCVCVCVCIQWILHSWALLDICRKAFHSFAQFTFFKLTVVKKKKWPISQGFSGRWGWVSWQMDEFWLESWEFLLLFGCGLIAWLSNHVCVVGMSWGSIVNKSLGYIIEIQHLKFYFKKSIALHIYLVKSFDRFFCTVWRLFYTTDYFYKV